MDDPSQIDRPRPMTAWILPATALTVLGLAVLTTWDPDPAWPQTAPASQTSPAATSSNRIKGELLAIEGRYYVIRDPDGKEMRLLIGQDTELAGGFRPGDKIEVWTSPVEHAMAIRAGSAKAEGPEAASHVMRGTLLKIEGKYYVMLTPQGKEIWLQVSKDTELAGQFRPGDHIEVFTSPVEYAVSIKPAR